MRRTFQVILLLSSFLLSLSAVGAAPQDHPLKGKTINITILGISGWLPSTLAMEMAAPDANTSFSEFAEFARESYGYTVNFTFRTYPFDQLFQRARDSLANRSNEYNIIIVDSQWLGALVELKGIVNVTGLIEEGIPDMGIDPQPNLSIQPYSPAVRESYQVYPDGTDQLWALPEEGDAIVLYINRSLLDSPRERAAFEAEYGFSMPATFEEFENLTMPEFEKMARFFTRPAAGLYGTAMQHSRTYDFQSMFLYPFIFSLGGDIWNPKTREVYGVLNSDVNARAMEWNKRMLDYEPPGAADFGIEESIAAFSSGKVFSAFQWAALGPSMLADPKVRENTLIVPPPGFVRSDGKFSRIYSMGGQPWVINANNDPDQMRVALDFLNWWYLPKTQLEFARRGGNPTDARTLADPSNESINPWNRAYRYMLQGNRSRDFWHDPSYSEMLAVQQEGFTDYLSGQTSDPAKALDWIACQQQKILFDGGHSEIPPPDSCLNASLG
jgi:multiple sugar transport system substrate-binding protein